MLLLIAAGLTVALVTADLFEASRRSEKGRAASLK